MARKSSPALKINTDAYQRLSCRLKLRGGRLRGLEAISHSTDGVQHLLFFVYFVADTAHQNIHHVRLRVETVVPDMFQDHRLGRHPAGMAHQKLEERKLSRLQLDALPSAFHLACQEIQAQI